MSNRGAERHTYVSDERLVGINGCDQDAVANVFRHCARALLMSLAGVPAFVSPSRKSITSANVPPIKFAATGRPISFRLTWNPLNELVNQHHFRFGCLRIEKCVMEGLKDIDGICSKELLSSVGLMID